VLAALEAVDLVAIFEEDTPINLITQIKPNVLVKGGDYTRAQVVGHDIVDAMAAKCCWSRSCPASVRRHWSNARARARHERGRDDFAVSDGAAGLARPAAWAKTADILAILIALSLPWSTSLVGIFGVALLVAMVPFLDVRVFLPSLKRPICALPIALFALRFLALCGRTRPGVHGSMRSDRLRNCCCCLCCFIILSVRRAACRSSSPFWSLAPC